MMGSDTGTRRESRFKIKFLCKRIVRVGQVRARGQLKKALFEFRFRREGRCLPTTGRFRGGSGEVQEENHSFPLVKEGALFDQI